MKRILFLSALLFYGYTIEAQVGVQIATPNAKSILDLTNTAGKALILPQPISPPDTLTNFDSEAMVFYYSGKIYLRHSTGVKVLSPWQYDGMVANGTYISSGTPVGIGIQPVSSSPVNLQIGNATDVTVSTSSASLSIGDLTSNHMLLDNDEFLVKTDGTTAGLLKIQEDGGDVKIRSGATATANTVLSANGSIDAAGQGKVLQNGLDLIPAGTILMWYGSVDASGYPLMGATPNTNWRICDGTSGTPDLREQFIVGAGGNNTTVSGTGYTGGDIGGEVTHTLTVSEMPAHSHTGGTTSSDGAHTHTTSDIPNGGEGYILAFNSSNEVYKWNSTGSVTSSSNGSHSHTLNVASQGGGGAHENRPAYFGLIYIIKL